MQNRKRDTDVQNRVLDSVGEGEGGMFRENSIIFSKPLLPSCPVEIRDCLNFSLFYILLYAEMIELIPNSYNTLILPCIPWWTLSYRKLR